MTYKVSVELKFTEQDCWFIKPKLSQVKDLCIGLFGLYFDLVDSIIFSEKLKFRVTKWPLKRSKKQGRAIGYVRELADGWTELCLEASELADWAAFYLGSHRYFRLETMADSDMRFPPRHSFIHTDYQLYLESLDGTPRTAYVTIHEPDFVPESPQHVPAAYALPYTLQRGPTGSYSLKPTSLSDTQELALVLMWLRNGLIYSLYSSDENTISLTKLSEKKLAKLPSNIKGYAVQTPENVIELRLRDTELDLWARYYLAYAINPNHLGESLTLHYAANPKMPSSQSLKMLLTPPSNTVQEQ